jgi:hypothetical protein
MLTLAANGRATVFHSSVQGIELEGGPVIVCRISAQCRERLDFIFVSYTYAKKTPLRKRDRMGAGP